MWYAKRFEGVLPVGVGRHHHDVTVKLSGRWGNGDSYLIRFGAWFGEHISGMSGLDAA
jgi:hypothetical protein